MKQVQQAGPTPKMEDLTLDRRGLFALGAGLLALAGCGPKAPSVSERPQLDLNTVSDTELNSAARREQYVRVVGQLRYIKSEDIGDGFSRAQGTEHYYELSGGGRRIQVVHETARGGSREWPDGPAELTGDLCQVRDGIFLRSPIRLP